MSTAAQGATAYAYRQGTNLLVTHNAPLPPFCVRCGQSSGTERVTRKFAWHHPLLYLLIIFPGLLIYAIVGTIVQKKMTVHLPLCSEHWDRYKSGRRIGGALMLACIPLAILLANVLNDFVGWAILLAFVLFIAGAIVFGVASGVLRPKRIDEHWGTFSGACENFLAQLPPVPQS